MTGGWLSAHVGETLSSGGYSPKSKGRLLHWSQKDAAQRIRDAETRWGQEAGVEGALLGTGESSACGHPCDPNKNSTTVPRFLTSQMGTTVAPVSQADEKDAMVNPGSQPALGM